MEVFIYILISTFLISLIAFIGAVILFLKEEFLDKILFNFSLFRGRRLNRQRFFAFDTGGH